MGKNMRGIGLYVVILLLLLAGISYFSISSTPPKVTKYSQIISYFETNQVRDYSLNFGTNELIMTFADKKQIDFKVPDVL
ncbi:MAG: hypothetical protein P4L75_08220, partial [Clostridia bacterium]|nr:hypothetical protein [Clostridia bacterium]